MSKKQIIKEKKVRSEEQEEIIKFVRILLIVIIFVLLFYFVTRVFVKKDVKNTDEKTSVTEIAYNKIIFGMLLNRPYDSYYAISFPSDDNNANYYSYVVSNYTSKEDSLYVYYIDLNDKLNSSYIAEDNKVNLNVSNLSELKVGKLTLFKITNGKIVKALDSLEDIKKELQ